MHFVRDLRVMHADTGLHANETLVFMLMNLDHQRAETKLPRFVLSLVPVLVRRVIYRMRWDGRAVRLLLHTICNQKS